MVFLTLLIIRLLRVLIKHRESQDSSLGTLVHYDSGFWIFDMSFR